MQTNSHEVIMFVIIATILILALVGFTIFVLFLYQKKHVAFQQRLETLKLDHEKSLLKTQLEIQEQTFQNISREIHDNIGLSLTLAKLNLNIIELEKTPKAMELIDSSIDLISKSINDLSDISKSLNSEAISQQGLLNALQLEMERLRKSRKFIVEFEVTGNPVYLDSKKELVLFRIAQEALNNVIKHSDARTIIVKVSFDDTEVQLSVQDDGKGFFHKRDEKSLPENMKAGLANMQIRSKLINGKMNIESEIGHGTTILVSAPLQLIEN